MALPYPPQVLRVAAAGQRAAYDDLAGTAAGALNTLLGVTSWRPAFADSFGFQANGSVWRVSDGHYESGSAAAFAAINNDGMLLIAFRGSTDLADLAQAATYIQEQVRDLFAFILNVLNLVADSPINSVVITGHSLGGELAEIFAALYGDQLAGEVGQANVHLATFGSPGTPDTISDIDLNLDGVIAGAEDGEIAVDVPAWLQNKSRSFGNSEDVVFTSTPGLGREPADFVAHVWDAGAQSFEGRPAEGAFVEHNNELYFQVGTDLSFAAWFSEWHGGSIYALMSSALYADPRDYFFSDDFTTALIGAAVLGLDGDDRIERPRSQTGTAYISGGLGNDVIRGGAGIDYVDGGSGADYLEGWGGADKLWGGFGNDEIFGGAGSDTIDGGDGFEDKAVFEFALSAYDLSSAGGVYSVTHRATGDIDRLSKVEFLQFDGAPSKAIGLYNWNGGTSPPPPPPPTVPPPPPAPPPAPGDDYGNTSGTAHALAIGVGAPGVIGVRGDQDWFAVTLQAGTLYRFDMAGGSYGGVSGLASPHLYLVNAGGDVLAHGAPVSTNSIFTYAPSVSGTYYLQARAHQDQGTGSYAVQASAQGPAPAPPPPPPGPVRLDLDAVFDTDEEDDLQLIYRVEYRGELTEDIVIGWTLVPVGDHPIDSLDVAAMSGQVTLQSTDDDGYVTIRVTPQTDKVDEPDETFELHIHVISGAATITDNDAWGTIRNDDAGRIQPTVDEHSNTFAGATPLGVTPRSSDIVYGRGYVTTPGDLDFFAVELIAGATYEFNIDGDNDTSRIGGDETGLTSLSDPQGALYGPGLNQITSTFVEPVSGVDAKYTYTATETGTHYMAVREDGNNDIGHYFVWTNVINNADDYAASTATTAVLEEGQLGVARNERTGDADWFRVELDAGMSYSFFAIATGYSGDFIFAGNSAEFSVRVLDAAGNSLAGTTAPGGINTQNNQVTFVAPSTGVYYLAVAYPDSGNRDEQYIVGYDALGVAPGSTPIVVQPGPASGTDMSVRDVLSQSEPGLNGEVLQVGGFWGSADGASASLLKFDLGGLPQEASFAAIDIYLSEIDRNGTIVTDRLPTSMLLALPDDAWDESSTGGAIRNYYTATWLSAPTGPGWYRIDITDLYNAWQNGTLANNGVSLLPIDMFTVSNHFHSSDYMGDPSLRPKLVVYEAEGNPISGTNDFETLVGTPRADRIQGLAGNDLISAAEGADSIDGGAGGDTIDGGSGIDTAVYTHSPSAIVLDMDQGAASGGHAAGDALLNIEIVLGSAFADTITGDETDNTIRGDGGNDRLNGGQGNDALQGDAGSDTLDGGGGADTLRGGAGNDTLSGDVGADDFHWAWGDGVDTFSGGADVDTDRLFITGSVAADIATVAANGGATITTFNNAAIAAMDQVHLNLGGGVDWLVFSGSAAATVNLSAGTATGINSLAGVENVIGGGGGDTLTGDGGANRLDGSVGDDTLSAGAGVDILIGGAGADSLTGGLGNDSLQGDVGNDAFVWAWGDGRDTFNGGADTDTLNATGSAVADIANASWNGSALTGLLDGVLVSIEAINLNLGGGVDWLVYAATAAVVVDLGAGAGSGFASLSNVENVIGGSGDDALTGDGVGNRLDGGVGNDTLNGAAGVDILIGGAGNDSLIGGLGNDSMLGEAGSDTFVYAWTDGRDTFNGGADTDTLNATGSAVADVVRAAWDGAAITNMLDGVLISIETIHLDLADGVDWLTYATSFGVSVDLGAGAGTGFATLANIENVIGAGGNDALTGDGNNNRLDAGAGNDTLNGAAGSDVLLGGDGDDVLNGGLGNDSLQGQAGNDTFNWSAADGRDTFNGGADSDTLNMTGAAGAEVARATWNGTAVTALLDNALIDIESVHLDLAGGVDWLQYATSAGISVDLGAGTASGFASIANIENAIGGTGNDALTGDGNANKLQGGDGADTLTGAAGGDQLTGGAGADVFVYAPGAGADTVFDFDAAPAGGQDLIDITGFGITAGDFGARVAIIDTGADTVVRIDNAVFATLKGVSGDGDNLITSADFIMA